MQKKVTGQQGTPDSEEDTLATQSDALFKVMTERFGLPDTGAVTAEQIVQFSRELAI